MDKLEILRRLGVALSLGLLMGFERGWELRELEEGQRLAGFRSFGLVSLFGGVAAIAVPESAGLLVSAGFVGLGLIAAAGYWRSSAAGEDISATTEIALLLAFGLGALAGHGTLLPAASAAVVATGVLGFKSELHAIVQRIDRNELLATLRLLLISLVMLPVLPNQGYGPWQALNPYRIWWMVVLVAGLSYIGYFAIKVMGDKVGLLVTGLAGGLASSTATAIELGQQAKQNVALRESLANAIVVASAVMFPRMLAIVLVNHALIPPLAPPLLTAGAVAFLIGIIGLRNSKPGRGDHKHSGLRTRNPLDLRTAIRFGFVLAVIMFLSRAAVAIAGDRGVYLLAAVSGLADVDAVTLSLATMAGQGQVSAAVAIAGILIAAGVNTMVKPVAAAFVSEVEMGWRVGWPLLMALGAGSIALVVSRNLL